VLVSANNDYHVGPGLGVHIGDTGINVGSVLRRAKLPADLFNRGSVRLKPEEYYSLWQGIQVESGDPNIALRLGQAVSVETLDPPIFAALCSPNLVTAVRRVAIYKRLVCPMRLDVELSETDLRIEFQWPNIEPPPPSLAIADMFFGSLWHDWQPDRVCNRLGSRVLSARIPPAHSMNILVCRSL